jgi:hypothetical protein
MIGTTNASTPEQIKRETFQLEMAVQSRDVSWRMCHVKVQGPLFFLDFTKGRRFRQAEKDDLLTC